MAIYNFFNPPFPSRIRKFQSIDDVEKYIKQLLESLMTYTGNLPEHITKELSLLTYFKTITGITNDVVADTQNDTLTLASGNSLLTIVGTAATDTITFTVVNSAIDHGTLAGLADDDHLQYILVDGTRAFTSYVDINEIAAPADPAANKLRLYVEDVGGFSFYSFRDSTGMVRKLARDSVFVARNVTGSTIAKFRAVYASGSSGGFPTIALAQANSINTMPSIGITTEAIADQAYGRVMQVGLAEGVNTSGFAVGNVIYVSAATPGLGTATPPTYPNIRQEIGTVLTSDASTGTFQCVARSMLYEPYIDHGGLLGIADDDHTQYALLAGRAGGQVLIGGTGSGDDLTLTTTSHATKGDYIFNNATKIFLNDTADTNITVGLCINQGAADDGILTFKSSDVNHLMTDFVETDTFCEFLKIGDGTEGGIGIRGFSEATVTHALAGFYTTDDTAKSTAGIAPIIYQVSKKSGTGRTTPGANANLFAIRKWLSSDFSTVWLADEDGDTWQSGTVTATQLISNIAIGTAPLVVTSTTSVANLNADLWDGYQFADYLNQAVLTTSGVRHEFLGLGIAAPSTSRLYCAAIALSSSGTSFGGVFFAPTREVNADETNYLLGQSTYSQLCRISSARTDSGYRAAAQYSGVINDINFEGTLATQYGLVISSGIASGEGTVTTSYGAYLGCYATTGTITNKYGFYQDGTAFQNYFAGQVYCVGNCSALTFTDRSPFPKDKTEAYSAVISVEGKDGKLDHSKLHPFIKSQAHPNKGSEGGRNISALVSAQNEVIKDLIDRITALEEKF